MYGAYQPRLQGRWTMLELMLFEQYGLPKEHNHLWYDRSHGFWDFPTWWENDDGGFNPAAPLVRVWSEELFGTQFAKRYDFGPEGNKLYVGSLFAGPEKRVAAFQSAGSTDGQVPLKVTGPGELKVVSAFGRTSTLRAEGGTRCYRWPNCPSTSSWRPGKRSKSCRRPGEPIWPGPKACRSRRRASRNIRSTPRFPTTRPRSSTANWRTGTGRRSRRRSPG